MTSDLERRIVSLIEQTAPRLENKASYLPERIEDMRELAEAGEWGIALENLCSNLYDFDVALSDEEVREIESLAAAMRFRPGSWSFVRDLRRR
jgi:hypothetical protein